MEGQGLMTDLLRPITATLDTAFVADRLLVVLIRALLQKGFTLLARPLIRLVRRQSDDAHVRGDHAPVADKAQPIGPFRSIGRRSRGDMLIFVPRSLESFLIDDATG